MLFEDETGLSQRQLEVLLEFEHPLAALYEDWRGRDTDELDHLRESMTSFTNDILKDRAEKKYSDPAQPMYGKSRQEARECGEIPEWRADHRRGMECAQVFEAEGGPAYHEQTFPAFLKKWQSDFGKERCMFVLACTVRQHDGDGRFYPPARQAAAKFRTRMERIGDRVDDYVAPNHSCVVNAAMEYLTRPERGKEASAAQKK